ncbi:MAG: DMT family transporter [Rhodobacteraceae bacterium]|jgi:drug/metabolite transporter (DMT)-like permease|nr:DMT family transporter [Paracoccaceae bacterium]
MAKDRLDGVGLALLLGVQLLLAFNQIVIKVVNAGLQPVFFAGLRSLLAVVFVWGWMAWRGRPPRIAAGTVGAGLAVGLAFSAEFLFLFIAVDLTTVGRAAILMYSMPLWFAVLAHFGLGERIGPQKALGLALAFAGTAWAILARGDGEGGSLIGDICALAGAWGWALCTYLARRPTLRAVGPEMQLFWMVVVSGPVLLLAAPAFGPLLRDPTWLHVVGLVFQAAVVVTGGFIVWLWLLAAYPASTVAAFSFLAPVLTILMGAALLGESLSPSILGAGGLVAAGIVLINRAGAR